MSKKHTALVWSVTASFLLLLSACDNYKRLGEMRIGNGTSGSLTFKLSQVEEGWYFQFAAYDNTFDTLTPEDRVTVFLENCDAQPLAFNPSIRNGEDLQILPGKKVKVFEGPLSKLIMKTRDGYIDMFIHSTMSRRVSLKLHFEGHLNGDKTFPLVVGVDHIHTGL